jgi:hypothetical protein
MAFMKKTDSKVTPMDRVKSEPIGKNMESKAVDYDVSKDFSYFFNKTEKEWKVAEEVSLERRYPSVIGVSPFTLGMEYGIEGTKKMPARDPDLRRLPSPQFE